MQEREAWLALNMVPHVGPATFALLLERVRGAGGGRSLRLGDVEYPGPLREIAQAPPVLYIRGTWEDRDRRAVAIVGSRNATPHGRGGADRLAGGLARRGLTIVSGMARGIDAAGHRGALRAGGGTLAVLGS